jgi:molybdopterin/thiamine biosynthesis adenylyltransferase/proteasome lid subunit RPN8/RPN11
MEVRAAVDESLWADLFSALELREESAGIVLAGTAAEDDRLTLCLNRIIWVPDDAYELRGPRELKIRSEGWMPALTEAAAGDWQPIFFHTHPGTAPLPSRHDRRVEDELAPVFEARVGRPFASMILGEEGRAPAFTGRLSGKPWTRLRILGERLRVLSATDVDDAEMPPIEAFDRQVRAFGREGQALLRRLKVGIVGAGGTGSAVFEQLVRLGVAEIVLIDDDVVSDTNLTRIHGSTMADVGEPKVDVLARSAEAIRLGTEVETHCAKVTDRFAFEALRGCDVVFGCTDDNAGRVVLARLAYYYCLMVIDVGVMIGGRDGRVTDVDGRATVMAPGMPCLFCRGRIDPNRLREEQLPAEERDELAEERYAQGLADPDPAVVTYTTMIGSFAVDEMLQRLFGFGQDPASEILVRPARREIRRLGGTSKPNHFCADAGFVGRADREPPLGLGW